MTDFINHEPGAPEIVDRNRSPGGVGWIAGFREKAHMREGDAIAAASTAASDGRGVDGGTPLVGDHGAVTLLDAFEGRRMLIAYYFMWRRGPAGGGAAVRGVQLIYVAGP